MQARLWGSALVVVLFAGCAADTGEGPEPAVRSDESEVVGCRALTDTMATHLAEHRVETRTTPFFFWQITGYYPVGSSDEFLGDAATYNTSQTLTLYYKNSGGFTSNAGKCKTTDCGNGTVEAPEMCDPAAATQPACTAYDPGMISGRLKCTADCLYDISACKYTLCGDGIIQGNEVCDGPITADPSCNAYNPILYASGNVTCGADCQLDTSACTKRCGNGVLDPGEQCDGNLLSAEFAGKNCSDFDFHETAFPFGGNVKAAPGPLPCTGICTVATALCKPVPGCYWHPIELRNLFPVCY